MRAFKQSESLRAFPGSLLHFMSTPSSATRSSMRSDTVIGGMRRGLHAAVDITTAATQPLAIIDLIDIGI
jgi:hypothetical protein